MSFSRVVLVTSIACVLGIGSALAQTPIRSGQTVQGSFTASTPKVDDETPYVLYQYRGRAGERIRVRMDSDDFDAFLAVGSRAAPDCSDDCRMDDDGGGGLNASLVYTLPASGLVQIRANAIEPDAVGQFRLSVTSLPAAATPRPQVISVGRSVQSSFSEASPLDENDMLYGLWTVRGSAGQRVVVDMTSEDLDSYLEAGKWENGQFETQSANDDGGEGLNARLRVTLDARGQIDLRTSSPGADFGAYSLSVRQAPPQQPVVVQDLTVGESVRGRLDETDPYTDDDDQDIRYDTYRLVGRPGQRVVVRMESADFDPVLIWGLYEGDTFTQMQMDDDSGGGLSAQFMITLDEDGLGRLRATGFDESKGAYTLSTTPAPRPSR